MDGLGVSWLPLCPACLIEHTKNNVEADNNELNLEVGERYEQERYPPEKIKKTSGNRFFHDNLQAGRRPVSVLFGIISDGCVAAPNV
jgi:hypothetical protein